MEKWMTQAAAAGRSGDIMEPRTAEMRTGATGLELNADRREAAPAGLGSMLAETRGGVMPSTMPKERMTEDLLARLLACDSPETYLAQEETIDRSLSDYLYALLRDRGMNRNRLARAACVNPQFVYDIFEGKSKPERDNALMLAFALRCSLREFQRLLRLADVSELWPKTRRDAIIIWCIEHGYSRVECDDELYRLGERTILKVTGALQ